MASKDLNRLIQRVSGKTTEEIDLAFVGLLVVDPQRAIAEYPGLSDDERAAILSRDKDALMRAGLDESGANKVLSNAHSQQCHLQ